VTREIRIIDADEIDEALSRADAVDAIEEALRRGQDVEADTPRLFRALAAGEFLLMPAESPDFAGVKVATVAPHNTDLGLPKIHAWYLVFDAQTLRPAALLDGTSLTILRTPAVTVAAIRALLRADPAGPRERVERLAVIGSGPQADAHVRTLAAVLPVGRVDILARNPERGGALVEALAADGIDAHLSSRDELALADVIVTATSSSEPVLDLADVAPGAVVAAVGAHGPDARELGGDLVRAADLVVEARASAYREAGNLLLARPAEEWKREHPVANLRELVSTGIERRVGAPAVYAGVGMSWEDLAIVERILRNLPSRDATTEDGMT